MVGRAAVIALVVVVDLGAALRLVGAVIAVCSTLVVVVMVLVVVVMKMSFQLRLSTNYR